MPLKRRKIVNFLATYYQWICAKIEAQQQIPPVHP